jgi:hypothetical protein
MRTLLAILLFLSPAIGYGQIDTLPIDQNQEDLIESFLQEQDEDTDFDYNDLFEELEYLRRKPFDLNRITPSDLELFPFLSAIQKNALLQYIEQFGPLLSIYELQAVPHFYLTNIQQLLPFVTVSQSAIEPLPGQWKTEGGHQLIMRWSQTLEEKKGFMEDENGESRYLGDPKNLYLRYRFAYSNRLSFGFTAEKDEGETFFKGSNKQGFDFYSAHFFLSNPSSRLKTLALGDYSVSMGQGLILFNGFSARKGPQTTLIKRLGKPLRRYGSVNEFDFFRGAAATYSLHEKLDLTAFFSSKKRDANLDEPDEIIDDEPAADFVTSLQITGKHRTETEIADENAIRQNAIGGILKWKERNWEVAFNTLYNSLDKPLNRSALLYNQFYFNGNNLLNTSLDYSATWRNFHFFGETAMSDNGAISTSNGLLASLDQKMDVSILYRHFPNDYQALNAQPFAETIGARNETGLYLGVEIRPLKEWTVNAYFDQWEHPWLRFRTDAPGQGQEWLIRVTLRKKRKMEAHVQLKSESKPENVDDESGRFDEIFQRQNFQGRFHLSYRLAKNLEWRTRVYGGFTKIKEEKLSGTALFQDIKYTAVKSGFSVSARYVIFDTDDYAVRFYAYENDVLNSFTVPAYYDRGSRFYVLMGLRFRGGIKLEGRIGRTTYTNRGTIGSGQDEIIGPSKTDVKVQVRWNF